MTNSEKLEDLSLRMKIVERELEPIGQTFRAGQVIFGIALAIYVGVAVIHSTWEWFVEEEETTSVSYIDPSSGKIEMKDNTVYRSDIWSCDHRGNCTFE